MSSDEMIEYHNTTNAAAFVELLKELGRVMNEDGILDPENPLVFEPTFVKDLHSDFEKFSVYIRDHEADFSGMMRFEVPLWAHIEYLSLVQLEEFAECYSDPDSSLCVRLHETYLDLQTGPIMVVRMECNFYETTRNDIRSFLERFMQEFEDIAIQLRFDEETAEEEFDALQKAERLKRESSGLQGILKELDALVGLSPVKTMVKQLVAAQQNQIQRKSVGLKVQQLSPHLVFTGNPGTGKTTVARLVGRIYKELGLLEKGHVVETERVGLVAGYVGQTALKTQEVCESALGGVLFIDEAYSITNDAGLSFGSECIQTLLTFMENHRGEFAVVVAGYPAEMEKFLGSNPGLRSRFDTTIHFPDYKAAELEEIFQGLVKANDYAIGDIAISKVRCALRSLPDKPGFANGRDVRKLFQQITTSQAARCVSKGMTDKSQLRQITTADVTPYVPVRPKQKSAKVQEDVDWFRFGYV